MSVFSLVHVTNQYHNAKTLLKRFLFLRVKLLPIVIFWSALLLSFKVNNLWHTLQTGGSVFEVRSVFAESAPTPAPATPAATPATNAKADPVKPKVPTATVDASSEMPLTSAQFKTLLQLSNRREELKEKTEEQLPQEKATLNLLEGKIAERTQSLKKTEESLSKLLNSIQEKENGNLERLVKTTEGMKPKEAAQVLEALDFEVLLDLMEKIKPSKASLILSNMDPKKAGYLMSELGKRRHLLKEGGDAKGIPQSVPIPSSTPSLSPSTTPAGNPPSPQSMAPQPSAPAAPQTKMPVGPASAPPSAAIPPSELPPFTPPQEQTLPARPNPTTSKPKAPPESPAAAPAA
ncbi:MAG: MotE family protein [Alphaproteobacteria bacterium]|nr:MotE family protein [Alphaproteobacteria bacterium]